jgi:hypothetical protein
MKLDDMNEKLKNGPAEFTGQCCDCEADVLIKAEMSGMNLLVEGGAMFRPPALWHCPTEYIFKCPACFEKAPKFYPKTEIFTRCVGYLRPKNQMHDGKLAEVEQRSMFDMATM